jgi:hypothetical protein
MDDSPHETINSYGFDRSFRHVFCQWDAGLLEVLTTGVGESCQVIDPLYVGVLIGHDSIICWSRDRVVSPVSLV